MAAGDKRVRADAAEIPIIMSRPMPIISDIVPVLEGLALNGINFTGWIKTLEMPMLKETKYKIEVCRYACFFCLFYIKFDLKPFTQDLEAAIEKNQSGGNVDAHVRSYVVFVKEYKLMMDI